MPAANRKVALSAAERLSVRPLPITPDNAEAVGYVSTTPEEGLAQLEILVALGCRPHHRVLEIGCGALVAGYPVMQFLNPELYVGIDPNVWLRRASKSIAEVAGVVSTKRPMFSNREDFSYGNQFDFILSHSILSHASSTQLDQFLNAVKGQLALGGVAAASLRLADGNAVGSPGSEKHGEGFGEWQYPGVSWFRFEDVRARAEKTGLRVRLATDVQAILMRGNPKACHDWLVLEHAEKKEEPRSRVTLVTGFFRLPDREVDEDRAFADFRELAEARLPTLVFTNLPLNDPKLKSLAWPDVRVVHLELDELWPFRQQEKCKTLDDLPDLPSQRDPAKDTRAFLLLQNAKIDMLSLAAKRNESATHLVWIDFGIMKVIRDKEAFRQKLRDLKPPPSCILAPGCWAKAQKELLNWQDAVEWRFCGGFLCVSRDHLPSLVERYHEVFRKSAVLTWEVNVWAEMERRGQVLDWYQADHDDSIVGGLVRKRVCLNMIVKNEANVIARCLLSTLGSIDCWAIHDTGSTDDTTKIIEEFFERAKIPGRLTRGAFQNFAQARNDALRAARELRHEWDYALLLDADMVLLGPLDRTKLASPGYRLPQRNGNQEYYNVRLVARTAKAEYVGPTHEFLSCEWVTDSTWPAIDDRNDGGSRGDKAERDVRLLSEELAHKPDDVRSMFYLAQTYRETGRYHEAIQWYKRRIPLGGWDEEVWYAKYGIARCYLALGDEPQFVASAIEAFDARPHRGEILKLLAQFYRERGKNHASLAFAEILSRLPPSGDRLFVETGVYQTGASQELAISGFYGNSAQRAAGYRACADLTLSHNEMIREQEARRNFVHYARSAADLFGAELRQIEWTPPEDARGWAPCNPSVWVGHQGKREDTKREDAKRLVCLRTVNYTVTTEGQYPTLDGTGTIRTRNWMLEMDAEWHTVKATEIIDRSGVTRTDFPVIGFEDCRLWRTDEECRLSCTTRDIDPGGQCRMTVLDLDERDWSVMKLDVILDQRPDLPQKNWMPVLGKPGVFLYGCGPTTIAVKRTATRTEVVAQSRPSRVHLDHLRGGSQLISYHGRWLCLTHEVSFVPGRVYLHRFVELDSSLRVARLSDPFYLKEKGIEFAAGLAWDSQERLAASFGVNDASAWLAFFHPERVEAELRTV